jgi:hypothetical protein
MLEMGRIEPVREQLNSADWQANKQNLGFIDMPGPAGSGAPPAYHLPAYDWLWLCQAAAAGDYDQADEALRALADSLGGDRPQKEIDDLRRALARLLPLEIVMSMNHLNWLPSYIVSSERQLLLEPLARDLYLLAEQADLRAIGGMLALERGAPRAAEEAFEQALTLGRLGASEVHPSVAQPLASAYLRLIREARGEKHPR